MLAPEIKTTLTEIKFRPEIFDLLDQLSDKYATRILISQNKFQKDSRLGKPFGLVMKVKKSDLEQIKIEVLSKVPQAFRVYELGGNTKQVDMAIVRPTDKYELLRIMGTNAEETHDLDTGTLVAKLRRWEEEHGLEILGATENWVKMQIEKIPGNLREFVEEITAFAPGTLTGTNLREFELQVQQTKIIELSW
jgi:hypothetical protein